MTTEFEAISRDQTLQWAVDSDCYTVRVQIEPEAMELGAAELTRRLHALAKLAWMRAAAARRGHNIAAGDPVWEGDPTPAMTEAYEATLDF